MFTVKVEVNGTSSLVDSELTTEVKASVKEEDFEFQLGKILFAVEEMGYSFVTNDVYQSAIAKFKSVNMVSRFTTIYQSELLKVSVRQEN